MLKSRVSRYCEYKNIAISRFEKNSGLSNGYFRQVKNRPSIDKIERMAAAYPDLNVDWLLTGEGDMLIPTKETQVADVSAVIAEVAEQRKLTCIAQEQLSKAQEQMDRLIAIIERITTNKI